ncbi:hypothetical protein IMY05_016G0045400 [Salix suchowensis]|nr:hypothetical protein IMY05_016G0045400 [Salix suchowensis]
MYLFTQTFRSVIKQAPFSYLHITLPRSPSISSIINSKSAFIIGKFSWQAAFYRRSLLLFLSHLKGSGVLLLVDFMKYSL